ncbi:MAG: IPT/TIG domain-containing protein [Planctomycetes bacterium]|nr:IPT/TIG domain-containing protein [Planctomycetota bacterium]
MRIRNVAIVVGILCLCAGICSAQFTSLVWNGATGTQIPVNVGSVTTVNVNAYPGMNYALLASKTRDVWYTDLGLLEVDLQDPAFTVGIDGFNPAHPRFSWGFVNGNGDFDFSFVPYPIASPIGDDIYFQVLAQDPTKLLGFSLSNFVGASSQALKPVVYSVEPRSTAPGGTVTILGDYLDGTPSVGQTPVVTMGGQTLTLISQSRNQIIAAVPIDGHSGSIRVHTDRGSSPDLYYNVKHYVVVAGNLVGEGLPGSELLDGHMSLVGEIDSPTDVDEYQIHLEAGEELFVEVFNYDAFNLVVKPYDPAAWQSVQLNSDLEFRMPGVPIDPLIYDNDGGCGFAAGIGTGNARRFVAPFTGDYSVTVGSAFEYSTGHYMLNTWTATGPTTGEPQLVGIHPNISTVGGVVEIYCFGVDLSDPSTISVEFQGANGSWLPTTPFLNAQGRLAAMIPAAAKTGHLRVRNAQNLVSSFDADDYPSYYVLLSQLAVETLNASYSGSMQIMGDISVTQEIDQFAWSLNAGDVVKVRAFPFDFDNTRVMKGEFFDPAWLDPEVQILPPVGQAPVIDIHSGPGIAAEIGLAIPPFVAATTGTYYIRVDSWFFLTQGPYLLDVEIN